jgi:LacI family transcriptional regulator, repressor for deo operon, udp, cdd, tsx, nupC, and nupG
VVATVDVARLAGVSTATVSRVLNDHPSVRPETRVKVEQAMRALGFRVSAAARSLATAETKLVLALIPDLSRSFFADIFRGIATAAHEHSYEVLLCETNSDRAHERAFTSLLDARRYDGVISMSPMDTQRLANVDLRGMSAVACLESAPDARIPHVSIDDQRAAKDAVLYLLSKGHRRIGMINVGGGALYSALRHDGYRDALREAGIPERPDYVEFVDAIEYPLAELATRRLLALDAPPTAIFTVSDLLAIGALKAALGAGLRVPENLAVVGFDDVSLAALFEPALTTVAQPRHAMGEQAMRMLLRQLQGESTPSITLPHSLVVRRSA